MPLASSRSTSCCWRQLAKTRQPRDFMVTAASYPIPLEQPVISSDFGALVVSGEGCAFESESVTLSSQCSVRCEGYGCAQLPVGDALPTHG